MSNFNSIAPESLATIRQLQDAGGITQFPTETSWFQYLNGLLIQGGVVEIPATATDSVDFPAPYNLQLLGAFIQPIDQTMGTKQLQSPSLTGFFISNPNATARFYWWAIGV